MTKLRPVDYKLLRFILTGKKEGIDIHTLCHFITPDVIQNRLDQFLTDMNTAGVVLGILPSGKDFCFISKSDLLNIGVVEAYRDDLNALMPIEAFQI